MKKLFLAGFALGSLIMPAMAADMTPYYRAPLQALPFNWTGAYVGADVGGARANIQSNGFGTGSRSGAVGASTPATIGSSRPSGCSALTWI